MHPDADPFMLSPPPVALLRGASLFLDFDGTLVELAERPDAVVVDAGLRDLLGGLGALYRGRLAIVSGRSIAQLDALLGPIANSFALTGSHGSEHRRNGRSVAPARPPALEAVAAALQGFADEHPGTLVEIKSFGVALHYRLTPDVAAAAAALAGRLGKAHGLAVQPGKMMVELRVAGGDKGSAVRALMAQPPMAGTIPLVLGDDVTDEPAFAAADALGGAGILIGTARETAARYALPDVAAARAWLGGALGGNRNI